MVTLRQIRPDWSYESPKETIPGGAAGKRGTVDKFAAAAVVVVQSFVAAAAESVGCSAVAAAAVVFVEAVEAVEIRGRRELDA